VSARELADATPALLAITAAHRPSHTLVRLAGECDITNAHLLRKIVTGYVPADTLLAVVDLSGLRFIDASGVHGLIDARDVLAANGTVLVLAAPQPAVARMFALTGLGQLIPVHRHLAEALPQLNVSSLTLDC
jgi:anti-sigma B factor antagonist